MNQVIQLISHAGSLYALDIKGIVWRLIQFVDGTSYWRRVTEEWRNS